MPEIFLRHSELNAGTVKITGEKARYLAVVLRCGPGDLITIRDNEGCSFSARIIDVKKSVIDVEILSKETVTEEEYTRIIVLQALLKGEKMDWVVQKLTELGVAEIIPIITERTQLRNTRKVPRWQKIAEEASRQSGRIKIPRIREAVSLEHLEDVPAGIIFWEKRGSVLSEVISRFRGCDQIVLLTGPEGGFSEDEVNKMIDKGFIAANLGRRILRAETAVIAAVSIIQYEFGALGPGRSASH